MTDIRQQKVAAEEQNAAAFIERPNHVTGSTEIERAMAMFQASHSYLAAHGIHVTTGDSDGMFI